MKKIYSYFRVTPRAFNIIIWHEMILKLEIKPRKLFPREQNYNMINISKNINKRSNPWQISCIIRLIYTIDSSDAYLSHFIFFFFFFAQNRFQIISIVSFPKQKKKTLYYVKYNFNTIFLKVWNYKALRKLEFFFFFVIFINVKRMWTYIITHAHVAVEYYSNISV